MIVIYYLQTILISFIYTSLLQLLLYSQLYN